MCTLMRFNRTCSNQTLKIEINSICVLFFSFFSPSTIHTEWKQFATTKFSKFILYVCVCAKANRKLHLEQPKNRLSSSSSREREKAIAHSLLLQPQQRCYMFVNDTYTVSQKKFSFYICEFLRFFLNFFSLSVSACSTETFVIPIKTVNLLIANIFFVRKKKN